MIDKSFYTGIYYENNRNTC